MKILRSLAIIALVLALPTMAGAAVPIVRVFPLGTVLASTALTAAAGSRTVTVTNTSNEYAKLKIVLNYTFGAATAVTVTPSCSMDAGVTYGQETSTNITTGTGAVSKYSDSYATGNLSAIITVPYDITGCTSYKLVFGGTGANGSDLVVIQAVLISGS